jgi:hypothetical protein
MFRQTILWGLAVSITLLWVVLVMGVTMAHDWSHPDFAQANPYERNWLQRQKRPNTTFSCCSEADGEQVEEDIRYDSKGIGHYWINSRHTKGEWMIVPDEAVIREPNMHGRPVAWFRWGTGTNMQTMPRNDLPVEVFCYAPGPLL